MIKKNISVGLTASWASLAPSGVLSESSAVLELGRVAFEEAEADSAEAPPGTARPRRGSGLSFA